MAGRYPVIKDAAASNVVSFPSSDEGGEAQTKKALADAKKIARENRPKGRGFGTHERRVWDRTIPELHVEGRYKPLYNDFFKQYCIVVARMERFLEYLDDPKNGWKYTTSGRNGTQHKTRPEAVQYNADWSKWNSMINQIGGSPATDQRFHNYQPDLFDNPFGQI